MATPGCGPGCGSGPGLGLSYQISVQEAESVIYLYCRVGKWDQMSELLKRAALGIHHGHIHTAGNNCCSISNTES